MTQLSCWKWAYSLLAHHKLYRTGPLRQKTSAHNSFTSLHIRNNVDKLEPDVFVSPLILLLSVILWDFPKKKVHYPHRPSWPVLQVYSPGAHMRASRQYIIIDGIVTVDRDGTYRQYRHERGATCNDQTLLIRLETLVTNSRLFWPGSRHIYLNKG